MTFTTGAACTNGSHCNIEIDGASTSFTAGGTVTLNHLGGDSNSNDYIHLGSATGSPSIYRRGISTQRAGRKCNTVQNKQFSNYNNKRRCNTFGFGCR